MKTIDRSALLIRPREPYLEWAAKVDDGSPEMAEELRGQTSVYLVSQDPAGHDESAPVNQYCEAIFEQELEAWCIDKSVWPYKRDLKRFFEWFEVQAESVVLDLEPKSRL